MTALALPNEISYEIQARLDTKEHKLYGSERILFTSKADKPLTELYLHLWPNRFAPGSVTAREMGRRAFDALFPYGPDYGYVFIQKLQLNSRDTKYTIDDTILKIEPESPIAPEQTVEIAIEFVVKIPNALGRLGHNRGNYYISWWYPKLSVYDQEGWHPDVAYAEMTAAEPYEDFAKYAVELTVPKEMVVGATGNLVSEREPSDGTKTLVYTAENVHDFAWVADARYQSETLQWEDVKITSLYWPEDAASGERAAQFAKDALAYFSKRFGRYPYQNFIVAEVGMYGGAMEYPQIIQQSYMLYRLPEFMN
ncbi:MAG: M1 family metallopeptidase, partial [Candidatus Bipolaricaulota bacterium]|nr:M1 family metallopeptidase [Candidatus Bipolaricaulota bacterium]